MRRVSCALTSRSSISRGCSSASTIASRVISWNTSRRCGTFGFSTSGEVPADRFALAVLVGREVEHVGVLERVLELLDLLLLLGRDDVERLEVVVDVDAQARPRLLLHLGGDVLRRGRQVADVADRGLDHEALGQEGRDRARLGRRFDDDETLLSASQTMPSEPRVAAGSESWTVPHAFRGRETRDGSRKQGAEKTACQRPACNHLGDIDLG